MTKLLTDVTDCFVGFLLFLIFCLVFFCGMTLLTVGVIFVLPIIIIRDTYQCYISKEDSLLSSLRKAITK